MKYITGKNKRPTIKNEEQYEALRDKGYSKEKSARIANSDSTITSRKGGKADKYETGPGRNYIKKPKK